MTSHFRKSRGSPRENAGRLTFSGLHRRREGAEGQASLDATSLLGTTSLSNCELLLGGRSFLIAFCHARESGHPKQSFDETLDSRVRGNDKRPTPAPRWPALVASSILLASRGSALSPRPPPQSRLRPRRPAPAPLRLGARPEAPRPPASAASRRLAGRLSSARVERVSAVVALPPQLSLRPTRPRPPLPPAALALE